MKKKLKGFLNLRNSCYPFIPTAFQGIAIQSISTQNS